MRILILFIMNSKTLGSSHIPNVLRSIKRKGCSTGPWTLEVPSFCQTFDDEPRLAIRKAKACSKAI